MVRKKVFSDKQKFLKYLNGEARWYLKFNFSGKNNNQIEE